MANNRHNYFINSCDGLIAICHIKGHCREVAVRIGELIRSQVHVCCSDFRAGSFCRTAEGEVSFRVERIADLNIIPGYFVFFSIIDR